jgi:hypothetical protein
MRELKIAVIYISCPNHTNHTNIKPMHQSVSRNRNTYQIEETENYC